MPVQWVNRPNADFRGFAGQIASGVVKPGDSIRVAPSGKVSTIARIVTKDGDLAEAVAGQSVTLTFADEIDCSRGDVISAADDPPESSDQFETTLIWIVRGRRASGTPLSSEDRRQNGRRHDHRHQV